MSQTLQGQHGVWGSLCSGSVLHFSYIVFDKIKIIKTDMSLKSGLGVDGMGLNYCQNLRNRFMIINKFTGTGRN